MMLTATLKRYQLDLSLPQEQRWTEIINDHREAIKEVFIWYENEKKKAHTLYSTVEYLLEKAHDQGLIAYGKEIAAIADQLKIKRGSVLALQFIYEANACCTSVIARKDQNGTIHHFRTMDWDLSVLKKLTIVVDFYRDKKKVFSVVTWAGYVGIFTGMKTAGSESWAIAVNFRRTPKTGSLLNNMQNAISGNWPIGFLVRNTLASSYTFKEAEKVFSEESLISPTYFSISGINKIEGVILARSSTKLVSRRFIDQNGYLIQTNIDFDKLKDPDDPNILRSKERHWAVDEKLKKQKYIDEESLRSLTSLPLVNNDITVYKVYMCAAEERIELIN